MISRGVDLMQRAVSVIASRRNWCHFTAPASPIFPQCEGSRPRAGRWRYQRNSGRRRARTSCGLRSGRRQSGHVWRTGHGRGHRWNSLGIRVISRCTVIARALTIPLSHGRTRADRFMSRKRCWSGSACREPPDLDPPLRRSSAVKHLGCDMRAVHRIPGCICRRKHFWVQIERKIGPRA